MHHGRQTLIKARSNEPPLTGRHFFADLTLDPPRLTIASENHNIRQTATSANR